MSDPIGRLFRGESQAAVTARRMLPLLLMVGAVDIVAILFVVRQGQPVVIIAFAFGLIAVGTTIGVLLIAVGLGSVRAGERRTKRVEHSMEDFFELSVDLFVVADFDGHFRRVNGAWQSTLGYHLHEQVGRPFMEFIHPDDHEATFAAYDSLMHGHDLTQFENRFLAHDGSYHWLQWSCLANVSEQRIRCVARDVTDAKREAQEAARRAAELDAEREAARIAAEQASEAKSEFLSSMSHELRTPLNAILGFSELMRDMAHADGSLHVDPEWAEYVQRGGQQILELVNDILDLSKVEAGRLELQLATFDLGAAIEGVIAQLRPLADAKGQTVSAAVPEGATLEADRARFVQILLNLLSNAIKYTPQGGSIDLSATLEPDAVTVSMADTGIGIAPEDQARVFDEFWQARGTSVAATGTGLGLPLTLRLVEAHRGRIELESTPGAGSCFTVILPVPGKALAEGRALAAAPA